MTRPHCTRLLKLLVLVTPLSACPATERPMPRGVQGIVEFDERVISFETTGRVTSLDVETGDSIAAGQVLAQLADDLERSLRAARTAELAAAEAQLSLLAAGTPREDLRAISAEIASLRAQEGALRLDIDRTTPLVGRQVLPQSRLDDLAAKLDSLQEQRKAQEERLKRMRHGARDQELAAAQARVEAARAAVTAEDVLLSRYVLRSPIGGTVIDVHVAEGEMAAIGARAVTTADLDHPFVDVFVAEGEVNKFQLGTSAAVRVDGLAKPLPGRVEHIDPRTEFTPHFLFSDDERPNLVLRVRIRIHDPKHLLHAGVPAFVTLKKPEGTAP